MDASTSSLFGAGLSSKFSTSSRRTAAAAKTKTNRPGAFDLFTSPLAPSQFDLPVRVVKPKTLLPGSSKTGRGSATSPRLAKLGAASSRRRSTSSTSPRSPSSRATGRSSPTLSPTSGRAAAPPQSLRGYQRFEVTDQTRNLLGEHAPSRATIAAGGALGLPASACVRHFRMQDIADVPLTRLHTVLRTGDEAVDFFSQLVGALPTGRGGGNALGDVEKLRSAFVYANVAPCAANVFAPFDLVVVAADKAEPSHYIISSRGLVYMTPNNPVEHITLSEWVRWKRNFAIMQRMRTFGRFLPNKIFKNWRRATMMQRYLRKFKRVQGTLLHSHPKFSPTLLEIKERLAELDGISLLFFLSGEKHMRATYSSASFIEHQDAHWSEVQDRIEGIILWINDRVATLAAKVHSDAVQSMLQTESSDAWGEHGASGGGAKTQSMAVEREQRKERFRERQRQLAACAVVGTFVRTVDQLTRQALLACVTTSFTQLSHALKHRTKELISISFVYEEANAPLSLVPSLTEVHAIFDGIFDTVVKGLHGMERVLFLRDLTTYLHDEDSTAVADIDGTGAVGGAAEQKVTTFGKTVLVPTAAATKVEAAEAALNGSHDTSTVDLIGLLDVSITHQNALRRINEQLDADFESARIYAVHEHEKYVPIVTFAYEHQLVKGGFLVPDAMLVDFNDIDGDGELDFNIEVPAEVSQRTNEIMKDIRRMEKWTNLVETMRMGPSQTGSFHVQSRQLREILEPVVGGSMVLLKKSLTSLFRVVGQRELDENSAVIAQLSTRPTGVSEFATFIQTLGEAEKNGGRTAAGAKTVDTIHRLLSGLRVHLVPDDEVRLDDLRATVPKLEERFAAAHAFVDGELGEMQGELGALVRDVAEELEEMERELVDEEGELYSLEIESEDATQIVYEFSEQLEQCKELWERLTNERRLCGLAPMDLPPLPKAIEAFERIENLWSTISSWEVRTHDWLDSVPFLHLNTEAVAKEAQGFFGAAFKLAKKFPQNPRSATIKKKTGDFMKMKSTLLELGNKNLKERHWVLLFDLIERSAEGDDYQHATLREFVTWGLFAPEHAEEISTISGNASGEAGIEKSLRDVEEGWKVTMFTINPYREEDYDDVFILGGVDEIMALLEDNLVSLATMLGSRYIMGVQDMVAAWEMKLKLLAESLEEWGLLQREWMYLDSIFCADDIKKQLPAESVQFEAINRGFIKLMRKCNSNPSVIDSVAEGDKNLRFFRNANMELDSVRKALEEYLGTKRAAFPRFYFLSNDQLLEILSQTRDPTAVQPHLGKCFDAVKSVVFCDGVDDTMMITAMIDNIKSEQVQFTSAVACTGPVEYWLLAMEKMMKKTLYDITQNALSVYPDYDGAIHRKEWLKKWPAQCVLVVDQIWWTTNVETAIRSAGAGDRDALKNFLEYSIAQINEMVEMIRGKLAKLVSTMLSALMVLDVHARETTRILVNKNVNSMYDFEWTRQLRYYWEDDVDDVVIRQTNTYFLYSYEYIGNGGRLVITPLTDTCYMTLTGALHLGFGGAPAGPAGTGKTETTKDLAKALARQCVVFNCSDSLDINIMGRFFKGLVSAGAWACFDEFNRINIEVLSVIAQQIMNIQNAIAKDLSRFNFEGEMVPCSKNFGVFITMNPGYAGRTELPDNLKSLFRPVAMMVPDYGLIAEIILYAQGFGEAKTLSNKMAQLYQLSSEQLSKQDHYDFGMRAVKSVLVAAGKLKTKNPDTNEDLLLIRAMRDSNVPKFLEVDLPLFFGILRDLFPGIDVPFVDYGTLQEAVEHQIELAGLTIVPALVSKIIQIHETQIVRHGMMVVGQSGSGKSTAQEILARALTELHDAGEIDKAGLYQVCQQFILNPKSISAGTLYGEFNALSGEWRDGLVPYLVRTAATDIATDGPKRKWVCFDGPVDAVWIENMNTVLDDNKTLCLANSERIRIPGIMHMMFEVADLKVASPATVSRCGMVYMEQVHIGLDALLTTWLRGEADVYAPQLPSMNDYLLEWTREFVPPAIRYATKRCQQPIPVSGMNLMTSFLKLFGQLLRQPGVLALEPNKPAPPKVVEIEATPDDAEDSSAAGADAVTDAGGAEEEGTPVAASEEETPVREEEEEEEEEAAPVPLIEAPEELIEVCKKLFVFAFIWSIGACVDTSSRLKFNEFAMEKLRHMLDEDESEALDASPGASLFSFYVHLAKGADLNDQSSEYVGAKGLLRTWKAKLMVEPWEYDKTVPYFELLVPTSAVVTARSILKTLLASAPAAHVGPAGVATPAVLFMGNTGVGKSVVLQSFLDACVHASEGMEGTDELGFCATTMNFSAQTSPTNLIEVVESKLEKKRKNLLGPPVGKRMLYFIDDLNMPALEEYGAQPPIELLRQWIDKGGYWTVTAKAIFFKHIENVFFAASMAPPGGGRMEVTERLTRHFYLVWLADLEADAMVTIFSKIFSGFLSHEIPALTESAEAIVRASVEIFSRVQVGLLPTPAKSHYTFNLRDLSKVFQGILMVKPKQVADLPALARLWVHEEQRVFRDRLISNDDRLWFNSLLHEMVTGEIGMEDGPEWGPVALDGILWGSYCAREDKLYTEIADSSKLPSLFEEILMEYNVQLPAAEMNLVFFTDCIRHISRVCRVLMQPRGNALLVGVGGSGRKSVTRLSCYINDMTCGSIEVRRGYGKNEWHDDLKKILIDAGAENQPGVFLFSDTQIVDEDFLEDINGILNAGEVPNLFAPEDLSHIIGLMRPRAAEEGRRQTRDALLQYFVETVRANLHLVLCFSPTGSSFRDRCRMFPSLVNCCTIDWFDPWPQDALHSVAHQIVHNAAFAGGAENDELGIIQFIEPLCEMAVSIHRSVEAETENFYNALGRRCYTTPTSYLELLKLYLSLLKEQQHLVNLNLSRYVGGLSKLEEAGVQVAALNVKLTAMQPQLKKASADVADLLIVLARDQKVAGEAEVLANKEADAAGIIAEEVGIMKVDCQKDLDLALPAFHAALAALKKLDKSKIQEVKALAHPPPGVVMTMETVCILMGEKTDWKSAKKMMGDMKFLDKLKEYDKDNIEPKKIRKMQKYMKNPDFTPEKMASVSIAAQCLTSWVHAIVIYDKVAKQVGPKKAALAEASEHLLEVQGKVDAKLAELAKIKGKLADLQAQYDAAIAKKGALAYKAQQTTIKLGRATELIGGLGGEKTRWEASSARLSAQKAALVGNAMLCGGALAYLGPFTAQFRSAIAEGWVTRCVELSLPVASNFSLEETLADPVAVREWRVCGLPADNFSTENGLMATSSSRWPLCIDPQGQANRWVKKMNRGSLEITKQNDPNFMRTLENAIRYGKPVLLENVGEVLDPALEPILLKQVFKKSGQWLLRLGDQDVPYDFEFKLFITTKMPNPHYMPEVCIKVTVINFTVTMFGLEEQLLVDVMRSERNDLAKKSDQLVVDIAKCKNQLTSVEKQILKLLAEVKAENMLDDEELIKNLKQSKITSTEVGEALSSAEETSAIIANTREGYRSVATRGSVIYFVIASLASVNAMYQYSLQYFKNVCNLVMKRAEERPTVDERVTTLISDISQAMFISICRGIFERDKLLFAFKISIDVLRQSGSLSDAYWNTFLVGIATQTTDEKPSDLESVVTQKQWDCLCGLRELTPAMATLFDAVTTKGRGGAEIFESFLASKNPFDSPVHYGEDRSVPEFAALSIFERLLLVRIFHDDKMTDAVRIFVGKQLGQIFTQSPPFDIRSAYMDSDCNTPLIFVLSTGADPKEYLIRLAEENGKTEASGLDLLSLGQGQGPKAEKFMSDGRRSGNWVCLQNCHLAVSWLPQLELIIEAWQSGDSDVKGHADFRLWLTSMPTGAFPVPVLQNGIKITNEPPLGLKANLRQNFLNMEEDDFGDIDEGKEQEWQKMLFAVIFYNAVCTERKKFGPVGWNIQYGWMQSDLNTGILMLRNYLNEQDDVPYDTIVNMVGAICFGGRCTDKWDKRCNVSVLRQYIIPALLDDEFRFSSSGLYYAPSYCATKEEMMLHIEGLPITDAPDVFGLHDNADVTFQQQQTKTMLGTLITMMGGGGGGGGGDGADEKVKRLASAFSARFPPILDDEDAHETTYARIADGSVNSVGVVCSQEVVRFNTLRRAVAKNLSDLQKAIVGTIVMSGPIETIYNCFIFNVLPDAWGEDGEGYPSLKPLSSWSNDFLDRLDFIGKWLHEGPPPTFCISYFFFPQGFMTGVKQTFSRKTKIAIDTLMFKTNMTRKQPSDITIKPENGVYIHGAFMQGARFDQEKMLMAESYPNELFDILPAIQLEPIRKADYTPSNVYNIPFYKTSRRAGTLSTTGHSTNFVMPLKIPSTRSEDHWICRGAALLSMLDD